MCNSLESLWRLVVVWEQFHDCYLLKLPAQYFLEKVFEIKLSVVYFFLRNSLWQVRDVSQKFSEKKTSFWILFLRKNNLVIFVLPLLAAKWRRLLGGSSWKLLELTSASRFLAYCTCPHKWRISVACGKNLCEVKKFVQPTYECHDVSS